MDQQRPQIGIAAFADSQQGLLATAGTLPWHQTEPGRQLSAILEVSGIADRCHQCTGCDRTNPRYLRELSAGGILAMPDLNLDFQLIDLPIKFLANRPRI